MHAAPLPSVALSPDLAGRLSTILLALSALIARRFLRDPLRVAFIRPLCARLALVVHRLTFRFARLAAGIPPSRPPCRRPAAACRASAPRLLPGGRAWLVAALGYEAAGFASQLNALLAEPEIAALAASDPVLARTLRPVRHMLGLSAPRKPRPPRPARPRPAPAPRIPRPWWMPPRRLRSNE